MKLILSSRENSNDFFSTDSGVSSSRPTSSSLSKFMPLPSIGTKLNLNQDVIIGLRLPNGKKLQCTFLNSNKVDKILEFAVNELKKTNHMIKKQNYTLIKFPNIEINDINKSIESQKIENKDMLLVIEKRSLTSNIKNH